MQRSGDDHEVSDTPTEMTPLVDSRRKFSTSARVTAVVLIILIVAWAAYTSLIAPLLLPIVISPTIWMFYYHSSLPPTQKASPERLFWVYLGTAIPGLPIAMLLQGVLLIPFVTLVFGSKADFFWHEFATVKKESDIRDDAHRAARAEFTATPSYWAFVFYMSFIIAAGMEELLKYAMVMIGKGKGKVVHPKEYIMYGAAAGLGFATLENIGWVIPACQSESGARLLLTVAERMGLGVPLHVIAGMLTAAGMALRDLGKAKLGHLGVVGPSMFFHGLFDFVLFGYCAWSGNIGWIHPENVGGMVFLLVATVAVGVATFLTLRARIVKLGVDSAVVT